MNLLVDKLMMRGMKMTKENTIEQPNLHNAVLTVYDRGGILINNTRSYMTKRINGG